MPGFEPNRLTSYTDDQILLEIKRVALTFFGGRCPRVQEFDKHARVHPGTVRERFGSWANAMAKAGFTRTSHQIDLSDLKDDLLRIANLNPGQYFGPDYYLAHGGRYCPQTLKSRLGHSTWSALLKNVLSLEKPRHIIVLKQKRRPPTEDELFAEMKRVWDSLGRRPSIDEFRKLGRIGSGAFRRRFGSWASVIDLFCERHGYSAHGISRCSVTPSMLLAELRRIAEKNGGKSLEYTAYKRLGGAYSQNTFHNHFGCWTNALAKLGLARERVAGSHRLHFSEEDYFAELQHIWERLGRQPKGREMKVHGSRMSAQAFQHRFGSWIKAIHAFCKDRASGDEAIAAQGADEVLPNVAATLPEPSSGGNPQPSDVPEATDTGIRIDDPASAGPQIIQMTTPRLPSLRLRFRVFLRDRFTCVRCGRSPAKDPVVELHVDHRHPYSAGGETVLENLETLCKECNLGKGDMLV